MKTFILTLIILTISLTSANAKVKRGEFTKNGYIMYHERNDYKNSGTGYQGYNPNKYNYNQRSYNNNY